MNHYFGDADLVIFHGITKKHGEEELEIPKRDRILRKCKVHQVDTHEFLLLLLLRVERCSDRHQRAIQIHKHSRAVGFGG